jgi:hypothetical protein
LVAGDGGAAPRRERRRGLVGEPGKVGEREFLLSFSKKRRSSTHFGPFGNDVELIPAKEKIEQTPPKPSDSEVLEMDHLSRSCCVVSIGVSLSTTTTKIICMEKAV